MRPALAWLCAVALWAVGQPVHAQSVTAPETEGAETPRGPLRLHDAMHAPDWLICGLTEIVALPAEPPNPRPTLTRPRTC